MVCVRVRDIAAGQGHLDVIRFLLSNGADASLTDSEDETARDVAIRFRQLAAIRILSPNIGTSAFSRLQFYARFYSMIVICLSVVCPSVLRGCIVAKRCEIGPRLLLIINRKSHIGFQIT